MDKKNTMLLTVIAVATLLVAVVGATFAYFSVTGQADTETTIIETSTTDVGSVALGGGTTGIAMHLTGAQMAQNTTVQGAWYATTTGTPAYKTAQNHEVATATLTPATADDENTYYCAWLVNVTVTDNAEKGLVAALAAETTNKTTAQLVVTGAGLSETVDLRDFATTTTRQWTAEVTLDKNTTTESVVADLFVTNENFSQSTLEGSGLEVSITNTGFVCDTQSMPTPVAD